MNKRKHAGKLLAGILAAALLLAGCQGAGQSSGEALNVASGGQAGGEPVSTQAGGYVEQNVTPGDMGEAYEKMMGGFELRSDGSVLMSGISRQQRAPIAWTSADGIEWQEADNTPVAELCKALGEEVNCSATLLPDGTWWVMASYMYTGEFDAPVATQEEGGVENSAAAAEEAAGSGVQQGTAGMAVYKIAPGGQPEAVELPVLEKAADAGMHYNTWGIQQSGTGIVCAVLFDAATYERYSYVFLDGQTGAQLAAFDKSAAQVLSMEGVLKGDQYYLPDRDGVIHIYDAKSGKEENSWQGPEVDVLKENYSFSIGQDGSFCYLDKTGIHRLAPGGEMVQNIVEGTFGYAFNNLRFSPGPFLALDDGSYLISCDTEMGMEAFRYVFDESYVPNTDNVLTIWALEESYLIRAAAAVYSKAHPEVNIQLEYGRWGESGANDNDIIRALNTRLLADDAPDVLILDGLPAENYIRSGALTDLTGKIDISGCYQNIMDAYVRDGKAYAYPARVKLPLFFAKADDPEAEGMETLADIAAVAGPEGNIFFGSYVSMFENLYAGYSTQIFPAAASVDEAALRSFLEATAQIADAMGLTAEEEWRHGGYGGAGGYITPQSYGAFNEANAKYAADIITDVMEMNFPFYWNGELLLKPLPGGSYLPVAAGAVPANAKNPEQAIEFIGTMVLDDEVSFKSYYEGFPVAKGLAQAYFIDDKENGQKWDDIQYLAYAADFDWDGLFAKYEQAGITEVTLKEKLFEQAQKLYAGSIDVDAAVTAVLQSTELYFMEQQ